MKLAKKYLAATLCSILAVGAAGCSTEDTSWVYKNGEETMAAGVYMLYLLDAYDHAEEQYLQETYADAEWNEVWIYPSQDELLSGEIEGVNGAAWIQAKAQDWALEHYGAQQLARDMGYTLSEAGAAGAQYSTEMTWAGTARGMLEKNGVSESSLGAYQHNQMLKAELFEQIYGVGGSREFDEGMIREILVGEYTKISMMEFKQEELAENGDQTAVDEKNAELRQLAESYGDRLAGGEQVDILLYEYWVNNSEDSSQVSVPDKANWQLVLRTDSIPTGEVFYDAITGTEPGGYTILDEEGYYTIIYRHDLENDPETFEEYRNTIVLQQKSDEFSDLMLEKAAGLGIESNQAALSRYDAKGLKLAA